MKLNSWLGVLLLLPMGCAAPSPGQTTEADRQQFEAVKRQADQGDANAQLRLATFYSNGIGVARDQRKAVKWLREASEQGLARAQCLLGLDYANGEGVKMDKIEGARWMRRAADQGLAEAQFDLGMCYAKGEGVDRSPVVAVEWYRKAASQGLADAECELGNCYLEGDGVPKDVPEGVKWTRQAAEQGFAAAQNTLGLCYLKGRGVPQDYVAAYKWFNLAAAQGGELADDAKVNMAMAERFLKPEQVAEAQRLASEFTPHQSSAAAKAASTPPGASRTGFVNVSAADNACEVFVDGAFVGNTPARVKLTAGAHVIEVKKPGFKDYRREITITEGSDLTLRTVLEKQ
jgi:TPR repeat protein